MKKLALVFVVLVAGGAQAGDSPYVDYSDLRSLVAWSADGSSFAWRHERLQYHRDELTGGYPGKGVAPTRKQIDVVIQGCEAKKPSRTFSITTLASEKNRGKNWKEAERWLQREGYVFVAGDKARPIENELMETDYAEHLAYGLPASLLPEWMDSLQLEVGPSASKGAKKTVLWLGMSGHVKAQQDAWADLEMLRYDADDLPDLDNGTRCTVDYGPNARCLVLRCEADGAYGGKQVRMQGFLTESFRKRLPKPDPEWSARHRKH